MIDNDDQSEEENHRVAVAKEEDVQERRLCCSRSYDIENSGDHALLFRLLSSAIWKMWKCRRVPLLHPFDCLSERTLIKFTRKTFLWGRKTNFVAAWDKMPTLRAENLFAVEDLGHGVEGRCWLVCTEAGLVAVLKFFKKNESQIAAEKEKKNWDAVCPQLGKLVRVQQWGGHWALVMPHLSQAVKRDKEALRAVRETLENDYAVDATGGRGQVAKYWLLPREGHAKGSCVRHDSRRVAGRDKWR